MHADFRDDREPFDRITVIEDPGVHKVFVGDDHHVIRQQPDPRGTPPDLVHVAFFPDSSLIKMPHLDRFVDDDLHPAKRFSSVGCSQGDRQRTYPQRSQNRSHRNAKAVQ